MNKFYSIIILLCSSLLSYAGDFLFQGATSNYAIVLRKGASVSETTAAQELQSYLYQVSGARLPIGNTPTDRMIHVGWDPSTGYPSPEDTDQSFRYFTRGNNIYIYGGANYGTLYGVYTFLEKEFGIRWYSPECTVVPKRQTYKVRKLNYTDAPAIEHRLDFYYQPLRDAEWCAHNRLNENFGVMSNKYGGQSAIYGFHSAFKLVNPERYFQKHPEYYSLRNNVRQHHIAQLCLSNPDVIRLATESILQIIHDNPGYWAYDVSQEDNQNYCQCDNCTQLANEYGGQSGLMIWYVNQLADAVRKVYPDKYLCTLAYLYTRHAPQNIRPNDNVVVRLCDIECCFSHPLDDASCQRNVAFYDDLQSWGKLTDNIFIWDYVVCFKGYLVPYPNFDVLAQNIRLFRNNGVIGILEEGAHNAQWGEFSELRQWLIARLLWNPNQNVDKLIREFCNAYYGAASKDVLRYLYLSEWNNQNQHVYYKDSPHWKLFTQRDFTQDAENILLTALGRCNGDTLLQKRVKRLLAQVYFLQSAAQGRNYQQSLSYRKLMEIIESDPTRLAEGYEDMPTILRVMGYI